MAEPKIKTLQARFGFADADLKKPLHDEIIHWIDRNAEDVLMTALSLARRPQKVVTVWEPLIRMSEDGGQFIGFIDVMVVDRESGDRALFEAKTEIDSLGELFRQLRMYRAGYLSKRSVSGIPMVVVCPDESRADTIRAQGFGFLKYDPHLKFPPCNL